MSKVWTAYSKDADMTFIMEEKNDLNDWHRGTIEVVGFYYGEPDPDATEEFRGKRVASADGVRW